AQPREGLAVRREGPGVDDCLRCLDGADGFARVRVPEMKLLMRRWRRGEELAVGRKGQHNDAVARVNLSPPHFLAGGQVPQMDGALDARGGVPAGGEELPIWRERERLEMAVNPLRLAKLPHLLSARHSPQPHGPVLTARHQRLAA